MNVIKSCPSCGRTYSDLSLSFCLEDGTLLSADHPINDDEAVIRSSPLPPINSEHHAKYAEFVADREKLADQFKKTKRTEKVHPILNTAPESKKPIKKWSSSDFVRKITYEITGLQTFHAQKNLVILREYLNEFVIDQDDKLLTDSRLRLGVANFYFSSGKIAFSYDFQNKNNPSKEEFLKSLNNFLNRQL
jgi:hypothetical protein